jgi:PadR family transcriptional regulator, regulatory protein PadR
MSNEPRMTLHAWVVLKALSQDPLTPRYGLEISRQTGLASGTIYPLLFRLEKAGWLANEWEKHIDPSKVGRPRRRHYWLTAEGIAVARNLNAELLPGLTWKPSSTGNRLDFRNVEGLNESERS